MPIMHSYEGLAQESLHKNIKAHEESKALIEVIVKTALVIIKSIDNGGRLLIMGNGGSASDATHMAAEFVGRFHRKRIPLPAIALTTDTSLITAIANDFSYDEVFVRQCIALVKPNDTVMAISTSGNSRNVIRAITECRKIKPCITIGLTGSSGGELGKIVDILIAAPSEITSTIQEVHRTIIHIICDIVDDYYAKK